MSNDNSTQSKYTDMELEQIRNWLPKDSYPINRARIVDSEYVRKNL